MPPYKTNFSSSDTGFLRYPSPLTAAAVPAYSSAPRIFCGLSQDHSPCTSGWSSHLRSPGHQLAEQKLSCLLFPAQWFLLLNYYVVRYAYTNAYRTTCQDIFVKFFYFRLIYHWKCKPSMNLFTDIESYFMYRWTAKINERTYINGWTWSFWPVTSFRIV